MGFGKIVADFIGGTGKDILKGATELLDEATYSKEEREAARREWERVTTENLIRLQQSANEAEAQLLADVANARAMQTAALAQDDTFSKRFVYYFITAWSLFSMAFLVGVTFWPIPENAVRFADTILGFLLGTAIASVFAFMVGSNKGSRQKDETIAAMTRQIAQGGE